MSMELLLEDGAPLAWREPASESFIWRSAQERSALREFVSDIDWGELDLLIVDLPPGTQRLIDLAEMVPRLDGVVVLTIPSAASEAAVDRSMRLAKDRGIRIFGVIENMAGYACEACGDVRPLFPGDAGVRLAHRHEVPLLARVPFDPGAAALADAGLVAEMLNSTVAGAALRETADALLEALE
jgi:ATP-binding protein involved in chromosome partitioning